MSIALYDGKQPQVAVIHAPRLGETFWATRGGGAFRDGKPIRVSAAGELGQACLALITSPFLMESAIFFLALTLLFAINGWRRNREGSDWVELDENGVPIKED